VIEGYTVDPQEAARQWDEFDRILAPLDVPLFRVPGNHDVSNEMMRMEWIQRCGPLHYSFVHNQALFIILDTQDPPPTVEEFEAFAADVEVFHRELLDRLAAGPVEAVRAMEAMTDWNGTMPARLSEEQIAWAESVIAVHASEVHWTFILMHMPIWQGDGHPGLDRIYRALGDSPFSLFAAHVHNYRRTVRRGRDHIRLGNTGGAWVLGGKEGNFDHLTWVTMARGEPRVANIVLDGVLGVDGGAFSPTPLPFLEGTLE
jgi:hypothetical protein